MLVLAVLLQRLLQHEPIAKMVPREARFSIHAKRVVEIYTASGDIPIFMWPDGDWVEVTLSADRLEAIEARAESYGELKRLAKEWAEWVRENPDDAKAVEPGEYIPVLTYMGRVRGTRANYEPKAVFWGSEQESSVSVEGFDLDRKILSRLIWLVHHPDISQEEVQGLDALFAQALLIPVRAKDYEAVHLFVATERATSPEQVAKLRDQAWSVGSDWTTIFEDLAVEVARNEEYDEARYLLDGLEWDDPKVQTLLDDHGVSLEEATGLDPEEFARAQEEGDFSEVRWTPQEWAEGYLSPEYGELGTAIQEEADATNRSIRGNFDVKESRSRGGWSWHVVTNDDHLLEVYVEDDLRWNVRERPRYGATDTRAEKAWRNTEHIPGMMAALEREGYLTSQEALVQQAQADLPAFSLDIHPSPFLLGILEGPETWLGFTSIYALPRDLEAHFRKALAVDEMP